MKRLLLVGGLVSLLAIMPATAVFSQQLPVTEIQQKELEKRVNENKQKYSNNIDSKKMPNVAEKCDLLKLKVNEISKKVNENKVEVSKKYKSQISSTQKLSTDMGKAKLDNSALSTAIKDFNDKNKALTKSYEILATDLMDISKVDCRSDPDGFMAMLESIRENNKLLQENSKNLINFISDELMPAVRGDY